MDFKTYQAEAKKTDKNPKKDNQSNKEEIIPLLGLVGEAGTLLSEYKKKLRDGETYTGFDTAIKEELGDLLWYISNIATKFHINLDEVAENNLKKIKSYYTPRAQSNLLYDEKLPNNKQKFPREFYYHFKLKDQKYIEILDLKNNNQKVGDDLNDNSYDEDGYRYHDIIHLVFMTKLGWSPVWRKLLIGKGTDKDLMTRRGDHNAEDSGRSQIIEEAIILSAYTCIKNQYNCFSKVTRIDFHLLKHIKALTKNLEVRDQNHYTWNQVLIEGFKLWHDLQENKGGIIEGNLNTREIKYKKN